MGGLPSYLRRSLAMLGWIDASHSEAQVNLSGTHLGIWCDLAPRWRLEGKRIRFQLRRQERDMSCWIQFVHAAPWGATIGVGEDSASIREIHIIWQQAKAPPETGRRSLPVALRAWIRSLLPGCRILSVGRFSDRAHTLSGNYFRVRLKHGASDHLLLLGAGEPDPSQAHEILTQALLWLIHLNAKASLAQAPTLHLLVPQGQAAVLCHRSRLINADRARIEVWEYRDLGADGWEVRRPTPPAVPLEERDFRWPVFGPFRWSALLERVVSLAPFAIQRYPRFQDYDSLRLWGLEFARVLGAERDRIMFGVGARQVALTEENFGDLQSLVDEIVYFRRADSPSTDHPYYRIQAERWLECLVLNDVARLFPELEPASVYPQIPVYLGRIPGRVDILGADRKGNLVVMELKVAEDPDLPLQSLDYWGRVIWHNLNGDFERRGYFAGIRPSRARPKLYLVSPVFSFHDSFERLMRCLIPDLEVSKISINQDWRRGVKILRRIDCKCGQF